jgi:nitrous oxide reductase accessory protein NosL
MKHRAISALLILAITGCESETETSQPNLPAQTEAANQVTTNVQSVLASNGPKWKVEYSGDLNGSVAGGILTHTPVSTGSMTSVLGKAMKSDLSGSALQTITVNLMASATDERFANVELTLADGTKCKSAVSNLSSGRVTNPDPKAFSAVVTGELLCGDARDKRIQYLASLGIF